MKKKCGQWIQDIRAGLHDEFFREIYGESEAAAQKDRYCRALEGYRSVYGEDEVGIFSAPGRSEIGGNHTDHQHGKVLAASINLDVLAVAAPLDGESVHILSEGYPAFEVDLTGKDPRREERETSRALVRGVASEFERRGYRAGGFRAWMTSDVLGGSGLSSSAAFEIAIGVALSGLYNEGGISDVELAVIGQIAENRYFGKPSGLMDQMAASVGGLVRIDFGNPEKPLVERLDLDFTSFGFRLCIVDTKGSHADLTDFYAAIPAEMKRIAEHFGKDVLREVDEEDFLAQIGTLKEKAGDRSVVRALHFFEDNRRVDEEAKALLSGDFEAFLGLIERSGNSSYKYLQNVESGICPEEQNLTLALGISEKILGGRGACRVHGGGFAGTIQAFVPVDLVEDYRRNMEAVFGRGSCYVLSIRPRGGVSLG